MEHKESLVSKHSGAIATIIAVLVGAGILLYISDSKNNDLTTTNNAPAIVVSNSKENNRTAHTLTAEDILTTLEDKKSTELQISQFTKRNQGTKVQWRIIVNDVRTPIGTTNNHDFILVFHPEYQSEKIFPDIILAKFSSDKETELSSLSEGDYAIIEGSLNFKYSSPWSVSLEDSKLIKFIKK